MFTHKRFLDVPGDGVNQDVGAPGDALFSLSAVRGRGAAAALADAAAPAEAELDEMEADSDAARELVLPEAPGSSASDTEDERCGICFSSKVRGNPVALIALIQTPLRRGARAGSAGGAGLLCVRHREWAVRL